MIFTTISYAKINKREAGIKEGREKNFFKVISEGTIILYVRVTIEDF